MFIRKKKNPSGVVSVQVIEKSHGKYQMIKTIGSSMDNIEIEELFNIGKQWISNYLGEQDLFQQEIKQQEEKQVIEHLLSNIENILINGTQLILDRVFNI